MTPTDDITALISAYSDMHDTDLILFFGDVTHGQYEELARKCRVHHRRTNVLLWLETYGGDPHAAYRIARTLQETYHTIDNEVDIRTASPVRSQGTFSVLIDGPCKSAGTLLCLGASRLIMSDTGELGPLDTQILKPGEPDRRVSGLVPLDTLRTLTNGSADLFEMHFHALADPAEFGFSSRFAALLAAEITIGLLRPIYEQIDPMHVGEAQRSLEIAAAYGERLALGGNVKAGTIDRLVKTYPSHGAVIDRQEARELFENLTYPDAPLMNVIRRLSGMARQSLLTDTPALVFPSSVPEGESAVVRAAQPLAAQGI